MSDLGTTKKSKKAFDLPHTSMFVADPMQLRIVGGSELLDGLEVGPVDTQDDATHPLWDAVRLALPLTEAEIANVDAYGVQAPIVITKLDGVPTVVDGRTRVRWARVANARRAARGEPAIRIECKMVRTDEDGLLARMILGNELGHEESALGRINKMHRLMERGMTEPDIAVTFGITQGQVKAMLSFADNASDEVKAAVSDGKLSLTAGIEIVRVGGHDVQAKALAEVATEPGGKPTSVRKARQAAKKASGKSESAAHVGKREMRKLLDYVMKKSTELPKHTSAETMGWYQGVEDVLSLILGDEHPVKLDEMLARSALTEVE